MNRQGKQALVEGLTSRFASSESSIVVDYKGLTVNQMQQFRRGIRANGGYFKVTKARLMKRAAQSSEQPEDLLPYFKGQIGVVLVSQESEAPAVLKFIKEFTEQNEALKLVVGCMEHKLVDRGVMVRLAQLPSRDVLLAMLCGTLKAPITKLAYVVKQISEKKQEVST